MVSLQIFLCKFSELKQQVVILTAWPAAAVRAAVFLAMLQRVFTKVTAAAVAAVVASMLSGCLQHAINTPNAGLAATQRAWLLLSNCSICLASVWEDTLAKRAALNATLSWLPRKRGCRSRQHS